VIMNQNQKEVAITISLVADYTVGIYQTAKETQKNVKKAVETMTGLKVTKVDVNVLDVKFKEDLEKEEAKEEVQVEEKEKSDTQKNKE